MLYALILFCSSSCLLASEPIVVGLYDSQAECDKIANAVHAEYGIKTKCANVTAVKSESPPTTWNCGQFINCTQNLSTPSLTTH